MKVKLFPLDESLGFWVYRVHSEGSASLRKAFQAAGYSLTPEQYFVLSRVLEREGMNQSQLCEITFKDRHNMTRILNVLERHGFIERRPDETDRRAYRIFATGAGLAIQKQMTPVTERYLEDAFMGFNSAEIITLRNILERIVKNIEERA